VVYLETLEATKIKKGMLESMGSYGDWLWVG
jgi:hypothetical protein